MAMEVRRRVPPPHGSAPRRQQATGGEGQRVRVQAGDALPLPIRHTNLIFSALFAASLVYLMRRWQEKIRASTPLHVVSLAKIFAPPLYYTSRQILGPDAINPLPPRDPAKPRHRQRARALTTARIWEQPAALPHVVPGDKGGQKAAQLRCDATRGGEQLFEFGPSPLVFLPLLLIQGGGMDLSRVGEKLLSSIRSVPERAAAAAAAARAIAGLPPHERINLPSNSEDLVSIYGSNPQGQVMEELEEVFYEEEFDPIKYIMQSIPDEGSDATYFDEQSTLRLAQLDKIAERLPHHVMGHHEEMGMPPTRVEKRFRV
ncbi:3-hydroxy-3-methylglutaryl-coenzyme A reductase [Zea mays]|uniref:3-hydroxy-3-methylglutaryl-coenzyme A reductase n=1 Tax=Zea mays TaxID=4577 RepID=A0A3L6DVV8_MAIZE|nr:3-hydroxy-3-methylglutaryl-coenzyme A reductase [Zea mays]